MPRLHAPRRIQVDQVLRHDRDRCLCLGLGRFPFPAGQLIDARRTAVRTDIFLHDIHLLHRHIQHIVACIFDLDIVLLFALHRKLLDADELADAVILMHDKITLAHVRKGLELLSFVLVFFLADFFVRLEDVRLTDVADLFCRQIDTRRQTALRKPDFFQKSDAIRKFAQIVEPLRRCADNGHAVTLLDVGLQLALQHVHLAMEGQHLPALQVIYLIEGLRARDPLRKRREHNRIRPVIDLAEVCLIRDHRCILGDDLSAFEHDLEILPQFLGPQLQRLFDTVRIIDHDTAAVQIVPQIFRMIVKIMDIVFQQLLVGDMCDIFAQFFAGHPELLGKRLTACRCFLRSPAVSLADFCLCLCENLSLAEHLFCRIDLRKLQIL